MKQKLKFIAVIMAVPVFLMLVGCGGRASVSAQTTALVTGTALQTAGGPDKKSLVVYFSWSGNTQQMAQWIADESKSDIYRITPKEAYAADFEGSSERAKNELDNGIRPELSELMDANTMAQYDTVYVGFPVWWYDLPMPMVAFLENYDLSGKTLIPFFSHNGSSSGASAPETLKKIGVGANVLADAALSISGNDVKTSEARIREWVGRQSN